MPYHHMMPLFCQKTTAFYVHMQDAWVVDQQKYGSFTEIGYEAPTSTVFTYSEETGFKAVSTALDKCGANGQTWTVVVSNASSGRATYTASDNCPALTPNFKFIGSSNGS